MEWINTNERTPTAYKTGEWDGKNSDKVIAEDESGKIYVAHFCEGFMADWHFEDWYDSSGYLIDKTIVRWLPIPE